jgi:iron complex outermembrane receptor protein
MRLKTFVLGSTSVLVLAAASPAFAQTATPTSQDPTNTPAVDAQAQTDDSANQGEIVVTGLRKSLESAQNIKKNSVQQVDAIVAEDIGKLPDVAISDTAARIAGVQVERSGGEASRVLVRGLPDFATTYNGRDIFTAESRSVALQDFPAGGIAALEVFKTTSADLIEGGLAGEVNVRSRKPFDFAGLEVAGSFWGQYEKRSTRFDPNGNLLISDRWDTGIGEIGVLVNGSYTRLHYLDSTRSNTDFVANSGIGPGGANVRFPDIQRIDYGQGDRERPSVNGAVQWRPAPGLEFYGEALWQGFRNKVSDRELSVPLWGGSNYSNVVTSGTGANPLVQSLTVTNPFRPDGFQGATYGKTDTYQYAVGGKYDSGGLKISADLARTASTFTNSIYSMDFAYRSQQTVTANTGLTDINAGPAFSFGGNFDPTNPANYFYRGFFDRVQVAHGDDWQFRTDLSYATGIDVLKSLEAGFRYVDRNASYAEGSRYDNRDGQGIPFGAVPGVAYEVFRSGFPTDDPTTIRGYVTPTYDSIRDNISGIRTFSGFAQGLPPFDPQLSFNTNEKSYAGYFQAKYQFGDSGGFHVDGALGLRVVRTDLQINGISPVTNTLTTYNQNYTDLLPNLSAVGHFTNQLQLRLSYTETRTRPSFGEYNPGTFLNPQTSGGQIPNGSRGNPNLRPFRSKNYDASLEYYFARAGSITAAVFQRDLSGFIQNQVSDFTDPGLGTVRISQPQNLGSSRIRGAEAQGTTFLDAFGAPSWLSAFGVQGNVTYLDTRTDLSDDYLFLASRSSELLGVSKWSYNLAGFYESHGLSARLSYNYRSSYLGRIETRDTNLPLHTAGSLYSERVRPVGRLDFSASYNLFKNLTITADATNILAKPYITDLTYAFSNGTVPVTFPRAVRYEESVYSLGFRFRL